SQNDVPLAGLSLKKPNQDMHPQGGCGRAKKAISHVYGGRGDNGGSVCINRHPAFYWSVSPRSKYHSGRILSVFQNLVHARFGVQ
ncbi:hypothetical protein JTL65_34205, partial [Pseudomonas aeruginosa]|nr:hypothetical protein [Pseudomonas aeruginosa]